MDFFGPRSSLGFTKLQLSHCTVDVLSRILGGGKIDFQGHLTLPIESMSLVCGQESVGWRLLLDS